MAELYQQPSTRIDGYSAGGTEAGFRCWIRSPWGTRSPGWDAARQQPHSLSHSEGVRDLGDESHKPTCSRWACSLSDLLDDRDRAIKILSPPRSSRGGGI